MFALHAAIDSVGLIAVKALRVGSARLCQGGVLVPGCFGGVAERCISCGPRPDGLSGRWAGWDEVGGNRTRMFETSHTLLARLRTEDRNAAWERFVRLYEPLLRHWAKKSGFHEADAADLTQEVFVKLVQIVGSYEIRPGQTFRAWLFIVARNCGLDFRRRRATREEGMASGLSGVAAREDEDLATLDEQEYRQLLTRRALELIRPDFSEKTWRAFELATHEGISAQQVAERLDVSANAVYLARNRVLSRLREELEGFVD